VNCVDQRASESEQRYACCQSVAVNDSMSHTRVSANAAHASRRRVRSRCCRSVTRGSAQVDVKMGWWQATRYCLRYLYRVGYMAPGTQSRGGATIMLQALGSRRSRTGEIVWHEAGRGVQQVDATQIRLHWHSFRSGEWLSRRHLRPGSSGCLEIPTILAPPPI